MRGLDINSFDGSSFGSSGSSGLPSLAPAATALAALGVDETLGELDLADIGAGEQFLLQHLLQLLVVAVVDVVEVADATLQEEHRCHSHDVGEIGDCGHGPVEAGWWQVVGDGVAPPEVDVLEVVVVGDAVRQEHGAWQIFTVAFQEERDD